MQTTIKKQSKQIQSIWDFVIAIIFAILALACIIQVATHGAWWHIFTAATFAAFSYKLFLDAKEEQP